ncbi:type VI secretion system baseplate subunit TssG [Paracoccus sp. pheM1]|uniref:type VI secretion system baseplate subunit TssG n=1 Tax=Paracoccus sp. pheM1 TaxID=2831675 RepID=UPI001BDB8CB1|nr:type VI secretion system baseplate subunit TssG [Paracoccus sp. pheM1]MBT0777862.1 type VI secretion system baseplate subunit TssG [Paracoccus sp. pheM1]
MADAARPARPDLTGNPPPPAGIEAFALMRRLESPGRRFGHAGGLEQEPARLGQEIRLGPAACEVARFSPAEGDGPARIALEITGLFGPEGPMPLHLSRRMLERMSERWFAGSAQPEPGADRAFLEFCNLLQHRMMALYYRAFAEAQPAIAADHGREGRLAAMIAALAGLGLPGIAEALDDPAPVLRHATGLASQIRSPETLAALLSDLLDAPVRVAEFVPYWQDIPAALASGLGRAHAGLGRGAMLGPRVYQPQARAEITVGPLGLAQYRRLAEDGPERAALRRLLRFAMGEEIGFDLRLVLAAPQVPPPRLGAGMALGRTGWLGDGAARDRDDLCLPLDERQAA